MFRRVRASGIGDTLPVVAGAWLFMALFVAGPALAQTAAPAQKCSQGLTSVGTCANPIVLQAAQQRAVVFTQSKISYLGLPIVAPSDSYVDAARDRGSLAFGIDRPVPTTTNTGAATIPPGTFIRLPNHVSPTQLQIAAPYTIVPGGIRIR